MKLMAKLATAGAGALALTWLLAGAAMPAQAAGGTVYAGAPGNGCPAKGTYYPDIQAAVDSSPQPKKVIVCPGEYDAFTVAGKSKMTVMAKGLAVILPDTGSFSGPLIHVQNSSRITIKGFVIDGEYAFSSGGSGYGIWFDESSGTITKNSILHIGEFPIDTYSSFDYTGILVSGSAGQQVKVQSNMVKDYEWIGINVQGNVRTQIMKNRVEFKAYAPVSCLCDGVAPSGIVIENNTSSRVIGNVLQSNFTIPDNSVIGLNFSYGVTLYQSSNVLVSKNKLNDFAVSMLVLDQGAPGTQGANRNRIAGNTFTDQFVGLMVMSDNIAGVSAVDPHTDQNRVQSNKFIASDFIAIFAILFDTQQDTGDDPIHAISDGSSITGNKLYGYQNSLEPIAIGPDVTGTINTGNQINLVPKPGAAAAPQQIDFKSLPKPYLPTGH